MVTTFYAEDDVPLATLANLYALYENIDFYTTIDNCALTENLDFEIDDQENIEIEESGGEEHNSCEHACNI